MLQVKNLTKNFSTKKAVNNISFNVNAGEICAFIGKNGAGKTTTLRCISGILDFDNGEITINGISVSNNPIEAKKQIAFIPDNPDIYEFMTGISYLNFIADIYKVSKQERETQIKKYATLFKLTNDLGSPISAYSHGMKQKLVIISALLHNPELLILDEPFVGLDPTATHDLKEIMTDLTSKGCAVLFSTHILEVAEKLCDHVIIINDGEIVKQGEMKHILGDDSLEDLFLSLADNNA